VASENPSLGSLDFPGRHANDYSSSTPSSSSLTPFRPSSSTPLSLPSSSPPSSLSAYGRPAFSCRVPANRLLTLGPVKEGEGEKKGNEKGNEKGGKKEEELKEVAGKFKAAVSNLRSMLDNLDEAITKLAG